MKEKRRTKHKRNFLILSLSLLIILVIIVILNIYLDLKKPLYSIEKEVLFAIGPNYGLISETESLNFGMIPPGAGIDRFIDIKNDYSFPVRFEVMVSPTIERHVFGKREFTLESNESIHYAISLKPSANERYGNYSGTIIFNAFPLEKKA